MIMPGTNSYGLVHWIAGAHPGKIGWLIGPTHRKLPRAWLPYALDNDAFSAWSQKKPWNEALWLDLLQWARRTHVAPLWVLVPDVVADKRKTLIQWEKYCPVVAEFGWPLAFAVQDGMRPCDVPDNADVVFVGGTTEWKWKNLKMWTENFPRVHCGRVNMIRRLWTCEDAGCESVDGSGWFRATDNGNQAKMILRWVNGEKEEQHLELEI